jgi:peptide/nickel transport system substrate-binding protein
VRHWYEKEMVTSRRGLFAISRIALVVVVIVIILIASVGIYAVTRPEVTTSVSSGSTSLLSSSTSTIMQSHSSTTVSSYTSSTQVSSYSTLSTATTSSSLPSTSASTSTAGTIPSQFTWETANTPSFLDPDVSYSGYDYNILQNVYESLLWYNGTSSTTIVPWLAQNYTSAPDLMTFNFTLRNNIRFQDGEPLNSTAVYFSLNRLLIGDASTPVGHGTQAAWIIWQLLDTSLSSTLGAPHSYNSTWVNDVLSQNFIQITGPLTFTIHAQHPNSAFPELLANVWADIIAPNYVMQHDLALWNQTSAGYSLPYPTLSGNLTNQINEYFFDQASTCNSGITPKGCGTTYLDGSYQGSLAGTGPYILTSFSSSSNDVTLQANTNYWGGPYQFMGGSPIQPKIATIDINYVPDVTTRELDLENAANSGRAMTADVPNDNLYDVANRNDWLNNGTLVSTIPGVTLYGPYSVFDTYFYTFDQNVTDQQTGAFYTFQPFADIRLRLAFADAVNITDVNINENNNLGQVANNLMVPGLPPAGVSNSSIAPLYSYNLTAVQDLLLSAMEHPITNFNYENGTAAPQGLFNNTFGCVSLNSNGQCSNPVQQSISLDYDTGDTVSEAVLTQIASVINNVSSTYNMGLTVSVTPYPFGIYLSSLLSGYFYMYWGAWGNDYPWAIDSLGPVFSPNNDFPGPDGWNLPEMGTLYHEAVNASESGNLTGIISASNAMNELANQEVMYLWEFYVQEFQPVTSNVQGFYFNPSLGGTFMPQYYATLY